MAKKSTGSFKLSKKEYLKATARETAKMSYPGHMNPIVKEKTKEELEQYFVNSFPIEKLWNAKSFAYKNYDKWHKKQSEKNIERSCKKKTQRLEI